MFRFASFKRLPWRTLPVYRVQNRKIAIASSNESDTDRQVQTTFVATNTVGADEQDVITRLLTHNKSTPVRTSYLSLPRMGEAPDLLTNPRLRSMAIPIDSRLLAPFYNDVEQNNKRLKFFKTGYEHDVNSSFYLRSFIPGCSMQERKGHARSQLKHSPELHDGLPWESLAKLLIKTFKPVDGKLCEFYTHIHPPVVGRLNAHKDKLLTESWKVDIHFASNPTELLILDEYDKRWYALRFPAGGSGYVIDSALFSLFHAVRAGPTIQQSVLAIFAKAGLNQQMVRDAVARAAVDAPPLASDYQLNLKEFALPSAPTRRPRSEEIDQLPHRRALHAHRCAKLLRNTVMEVDPQQARKAQESLPKSKSKSWLNRVPRSVVDRAIATLPYEAREEMRKIYERNIKIMQLSSYGIPVHTPAQKFGKIKIGKKRRTIIDERFISIHGTAVVEGNSFHLSDYDGTENTLFRFAWMKSDYYKIFLSPTSVNSNTRTLALIASKLGLSRTASLKVDMNDTISGNTAEVLRNYGFELRVVRVAGELDNTTKRLRELERRYSPEQILEPPKRRIARRAVKGPVSAFRFFWQDNRAVKGMMAKRKAFDALNAQEKKVYDDKAEEDKLRFHKQVIERRSFRKSTCFELFCAEKSPALMQQNPGRYAGVEGDVMLIRDLRDQWQRSGASVWMEYQRKSERDS